MTREMVFADIYRRNAWHGKGTRSGPGSEPGATRLLQRILPELVAGVGARSVLDAPCGDCAWMPDLPGYIGVDIVPEAVEAARARHPDRHFEIADICTGRLPKVDLVFSRDGLQHLSIAEGLAALDRFRRTGATWLVCSTFEDSALEDIRAGAYHEPDMERPPYALGRPWMVIEDGAWSDGAYPFPAKFVGVWAL